MKHRQTVMVNVKMIKWWISLAFSLGVLAGGLTAIGMLAFLGI
jgi:hypothetical protein